MQTEQSKIIVQRFFEALQILKANGVIRGKQTFTKRYGINRWNLNSLEKQPDRDIFQVSWLGFLINDYKVSPFWLFGSFEEGFFQPGWTPELVKNLQKT